MSSLMSATETICICIGLWSLLSRDASARTHGDLTGHESHERIRHGAYLTVTSVLIEPYVMAYNDTYSVDGAAVVPRYYGFLVDLLDRVGELLGFRYRILPTDDGKFKFGFPIGDGTGRWTGMVGDLLDRKADLAAAPMFVTQRRKNVVDFSHSFLDVYSSAVTLKRDDGSHNRISTIADVLSAEYLTVGTLNRGIMHRSLRTSNDSYIQRLYDKMRQNPRDSFTSSNEEGLRRVREYGFYVFILPSNIAEYIVNRKPCDLHLINSTLFRQEFAFAGYKDSGLTSFINEALGILRGTAELRTLYQKWWVDKGQCNSDTKRDAPEIQIRYDHMTNLEMTSALSSGHVFTCSLLVHVGSSFVILWIYSSWWKL